MSARAPHMSSDSSRALSPDPPPGALRAMFPPARWLPGYRREWLAADLVAGITLAAYAIPVSLAYASLAGLPPQVGLYGYLLGCLGYALFGSSRQLAVGPTSAISLMVGVTLAEIAGGDVTRYAEVATLTALLVAGLMLGCFSAWRWVDQEQRAMHAHGGDDASLPPDRRDPVLVHTSSAQHYEIGLVLGRRTRSNRPTSSAATCCASAALPPLPSTSNLPPARNAPAIIAAAP